MRRVRIIFFAVLVSVMVNSCRSPRSVVERVEVPVSIHDTVLQWHVVHDSIFVSRFREVVTNGDTVTIRDSVDRWHVSTKHDTVYRYAEKPVKTTVKQIVTKEVKKPLLRNWLFWCALCGMSVFSAWLTAQFFKKRV